MLSRALRLIFSSLVRILLSRGMAYGDAAEILRKAYVEEGFVSLRKKGMRASVSGVAALTGLTRKEAARLKDLPDDAFNEATSRYNRVVRVVSAWRNQPCFQGSDGQPAVLQFEGENSFTELVRLYSGDVTARAMLDTLIEADLVRLSAEKIELLGPAYIPDKDTDQKLSILGNDVSELIQTIDHNIHCDPQARRFQRKVSSHSLNPEDLEKFQQLVSEKSQQLLEEFDSWLSCRENDSAESPSTYVSVGIYFFDKPREE